MTDADADDAKTVIFPNMRKILYKNEEEAKEKSACLLALGGDLNGTLFDLEPGEILIGRATSATHRFEFEGVSRRHFLVRF